MNDKRLYGPIPMSRIKPESKTIYEALEAGRPVHISRYGQVLAVIDPPATIPQELLAEYAVGNRAGLPELTATAINQGAAAAAILAAAADGPWYFTRNRQVCGLLRGATDSDLATPEPSDEQLAERERLLAEYVETHPDTDISALADYGDQIDQELGISGVRPQLLLEPVLARGSASESAPGRLAQGRSGGTREFSMTAVAEGTAATTSRDVALERATKWANDYAARLTERAEHRLAELAGHSSGAHSSIGEPTTGDPTTGFYVGFDVVATSPIQFGGPPPYQPSTVIAAGEQAFIIAFIFVNPTVNIPLGWAVPATVQLAGRTWRMTLDQGNLTTGGVLPQQIVTAAFGRPAATITPVVFSLATPNPGPDPALIEANVTVDIVDPAQPYAAFATNFLDIDNDPGFLGVPATAAGFRHELPNRYLIYGE